MTQQEIAAYGKVTDISTGNPYPWAQGPRRMGTDKNGDVQTQMAGPVPAICARVTRLWV